MAEAQLLRGAPMAERVRAEVSERTASRVSAGVQPLLVVVVATDDAAAIHYAETKRRTADKLGIAIDLVRFDPTLGQAALETQISQLSGEDRVHGVLVELPLDPQLDAEAAIAQIDPRKDVDGLTPANLGLIALGREDEAICPATPRACLQLAESATALAGKRVAVVGRGRSVGRALIPMLINRDATVTVCHSKTTGLAATLAPCDVVFVAAGRPGLIGADHLRSGQIVIDAGISVVDQLVVGDVDGDAARSLTAAFTPVPGGVGPLTSSLIFANLMRAMTLQGIA